MPSQADSRSEYRKPAPKVEVVTIYPDRHDRRQDEALAQAAPVHSLFTVVALVRDASEGGMGLQFEGQQIMGRNLLRPGERYLLKLTLPTTDIDLPDTPPSFLNADGGGGNYYSLVVNARCRWYQAGVTSKVGFVLSDGNDPDALAFLRRHFGTRA